LFSSADILNIDDAKVASLASESEESSIEITVCSEKIKVLGGRLRALQDAREISLGPQGTRVLR
jgi:hypothetical protein